MLELTYFPKTAAVIAEFNPFHTGHALLLQKCRETGADCILIVLSGNYVQRGEPAIFDRYLRTKAALQCGADVVIELPLPYALSTAERFAYGAISLFQQLGLGSGDFLVFGSESGNLKSLQNAAFASEQAEQSVLFRNLLEKGMSFVSARQKAVETLFPEFGEMLHTPNNTLGVEYLRQLSRLQCPMKAVSIQRQGAEHHSKRPKDGFASGSMLRQMLWEGRWSEASKFFPGETAGIFQKGISQIALPERGERAVLCRLRCLEQDVLSQLPDCSEGIENRLWKASRQACTFQELCDMIKSKRYSMARVRRLIYSAFLQVDGELCREPVPYCHLLGFTKKGENLLSRWKCQAKIPVSPSLKKLQELGGNCEKFAWTEARADDLYSLFQPVPRPCGAAYTAPVIRAP